MRRLLAVPLLLLAGCATPRSAPPTLPAPKPPAAAAADRLPNEVHWVRSAAEHRAIFLEVYALATRRLEEIAPGLTAGTWAVSLDADETVLDNSEYQKELAQSGKSFSNDTFGAWIERRAALALPGAVAFTRRVRELGGKVAIVTNRDDRFCPATQDNFRAQDIPFDIMLCKPPGTSDKNPRFQAIQNGTAAPPLPPLEIVLWVGDNIKDFPGLSQDIRDGSADRFADFGSRFFILPNPMYGSWESNPAN